ncbi:type IV conjugative transfer system coupling protein TraD [Klebsiella oxytoca]|uniref:type IV conjugative transfer system coupling protein TraD n=1 Tax=Klebsiella oxytoca TaxID=571 RepID=UPI00384B77B1
MSNRYVIEAMIRPPVEFISGSVMLGCGWLCLDAPWLASVSPGGTFTVGALALSVNAALATGFAVPGAVRVYQGWKIWRFLNNLRRLPPWMMTSVGIPVSRRRLWLGRGFRWEQRHTQRLTYCMRPEVAHYVNPGRLCQAARKLEMRHENSWLSKLTRTDSRWNPVRPLPPVGGSPLIHGIEPDETDVSMSLGERVGHMLVLGTTRVGKTRLAEVLITQDIRRGEVVIVFDPKGDADLLKRIWAECRRSGREQDLQVFHLGWPELSARYNAVGRFGRVSEVASRVAGQLSSEGNNAAFKEFSWRFVNIVARALVITGQRPDLALIQRYVTNMDELFVRCARHLLAGTHPQLWEALEREAEATEQAGDLPPGRTGLSLVLQQFLISEAGQEYYDPVLDGLRSAVQYDRTYYDKIVASLVPLLEKLTAGKTAQLIAPDYLDTSDPRPLIDWSEVIRRGGVVYIGLDALSDPEVAAAVGNSMFADLVSVAGHIYKFGIHDGQPGTQTSTPKICLHCDEFNELMGDEFIPMINKGGGAGMQVTAYTQTLPDIEAKIGSAAKAAQVVGNFNTLIMLRVRHTATAELLTEQLPQVEVYTTTLISGVTDASTTDNDAHFVSNTQDRISTERVPMVSPAHVINLPKGQAFALLEGGQLWKIRMPLPAPGDDVLMPDSLQTVSRYMRQNYRSAGKWW